MTRRLLVAVCLATLSAAAFQGERKRASPHETVSLDVNGKTVSITYGRPYLKGRSVGSDVAPTGQVWRLGADEATKMTLNSPAVLGNKIHLDAGSYSLFAIPGTEKWTLIVNKTADQWGAFKYDQTQDVGRVDLPVQKTTAPVEEFTISVDKASGGKVKLAFAWGGQSATTDLAFR